MLLVCSISLLLYSCNKNTSDTEELSNNATNQLKSHTTPAWPIGAPPNVPSISIQKNGTSYYCNWGGTLTIVNPHNPTNYNGTISKRFILDGQSWNVVFTTCSSAYYAPNSWGELTVNQEYFTASFAYCAKASTSGCADWRVSTQKKILVKVLNPRGALSTQFALVSPENLEDPLPVE